MEFVAIDFETATSKYTSICSMGICVVVDGKITERQSFYIRPVPMEFNSYNIKIHGITPSDVEFCPTFSELWPQIRPYLDGRLVIAHNTSFDINALCATLDENDIEYPTFDYLCTVKLSREAYPELDSHKLNNLCDALGISFSHHDACDDAYACAMVLMRIMHDYSLLSKEDIEECFEMICGKVYPGCKIKTTQKKPKKKVNKKVTQNV